MIKCPDCGAYIPDGGKVCLSCGWKPEADFGGIFSKDNPYINYLQQVMDSVKDMPKEERDKLQHDDMRWIAAAGYIGPAFLYTYYKHRDSELVKWHANQACVLFAAYLLCGVLDKLPLLGGLIKKTARAGISLLAFAGAKSAVANKTDPLPVVGTLDLGIFK